MNAETLARENAVGKEKQLKEEQKQRELLSHKRKLAYSRNRIWQFITTQIFCGGELAREDWNKDYVDYLQSQFINANDAARFTEDFLKRN